MLSQVPSKDNWRRPLKASSPVQIDGLGYQWMDLHETMYQTIVTHAQHEVRAFMIIARPVRDEYKKCGRTREDKRLVV
jgi:hypothetical protein